MSTLGGQRRVMTAAAAITTTALLAAAGVALTSATPPARPAVAAVLARPGRGAPADPGAVAVVLQSSRAAAARIELMSPATGRLRLVARIGAGNGFALAPNAKSVFVVGPDRGKIEIRRVGVASHAVRFVADGAYPAVSPDGRFLAYATGRQFTRLAVRDLRTGRTRVIDLTGLIGRDASFLNGGGVTWLSDGSQIAAMPGGAGIADVLPLAIAPAGDRVVYLRGSRPPDLWVAAITAGRLAAGRKLYSDTARTSVGGAAW